MNMLDWYKKVVFENYANFKGRARRSEYWYFTLVNVIILLILYIPILIALGTSGDNPSAMFWLFYGLYIVYAIATLIPNLAVSARRLHDIGKSGWNYLLVLIPLVGPILMLVWFATEGEGTSNQWGPNPKAPSDEIKNIGAG